MSKVTIVTQATSEHFKDRLFRMLETWKSSNFNHDIVSLKILLLDYDFPVDSYEGVEFVRANRMHVNEARTLVSSSVDSEFLVFTDDDFYFEPEFMDTILKALDVFDRHDNLATLTFADRSRPKTRLGEFEEETDYVISGVDQFFWTCDGIMIRKSIWNRIHKIYMKGTNVSTMFEEALLSRIPQVILRMNAGVLRSEGIHHYRARGVVPRTFEEPEYKLKEVIEATNGCGKDIPRVVKDMLLQDSTYMNDAGLYKFNGDRITREQSSMWITARHARHPRN